MSLNINIVHVAGRLTRDPQTKVIGADRTVANFSIAMNERWKDKSGEAKESVTFIDVSAWGRTAELVGQYLTKGSECFITGKLRSETWEDKSGEKKSKLTIVADSVQFIGGKKDAGKDDAPTAVAGNEGFTETANKAMKASIGGEADGIPF